MADMSAADYKALMGDNDNGGFGGSGFLWIILIFLFFLAFSGNSVLGGNGGNGGMAQVERDVLTSSCATQKEVLENRYANALQFANAASQQAQCCCELKTAIHAEGEATRALIQADTIQNLRDRLGAAEATLSNTAQSQYILGSIGRFYPYQGVSPCAFNSCSTGC